MLQSEPLLLFIKNLLNPLIVALSLVACSHYFLGHFDEGYFLLLVLAFLLSGQLIDSVNIESTYKLFWKRSVTSLLFQWFYVISLLLLMGFASKTSDYFSRTVLFGWFLITPILLITVHWLVLYQYRRKALKNRHSNTAVIVGVNEVSHKLIQRFNQNPTLSNVGFFDDRDQQRVAEYLEDSGHQLLGPIASAATFVKTHKIKRIYIALPMSAQPRILSLLDDLRDTTASIFFVPDIFMFDLIQGNISTIHGIPVIAVCESPFTGTNGTLKRGCDVLLSLLILLLISPLMAVIASGVKLSSPGPVLFRQKRYGLDGKEILVYKFRSMTVMENGDQVTQATRQDPRITRFGAFLRKTSLDELPQFFNVLQGRMSIVGPRPHAVSHNELYRSLIKGYMIRHKVKPGITGWAQVKGYRGETETLDKMQARINHDLDYLRNWSLFLDLIIIFKTIGVVIKDKNAY
ncbi:MAG: undecaprenyl-phosphate glucose phosphotransferase [Methylomonas sp.]|jgi:putative colanic acid biosynthesis UDP-glucose lipid carrier transferase|nr:MAG: undecaprenyl-phosphate glucose phosphotransferase [Methylomonas sp.]